MELMTVGYHVFPPLPGFHPKDSIKDFHATMDQFPEFVNNMPITAPRVLGGFAALGNPSSFHNTFVRNIRMQIHKTVFPILYDVATMSNFNYITIGFDRMLFRPAGLTPTPEKWHRDIPVYKNSLNFGGWINLGDQTEYFICQPFSQLSFVEQTQQKAGFKNTVKVNKEDVRHVEIPPGHFILFNSTIVHCVNAKKYDNPLYRLFISFRLDTDEIDTTDVMTVIDEQGVPLIPSGQTPPMFARLHTVNWRDRLKQFSNYIKPHLLDNNGVVPRFFKSLLALELPLYPPYTDFERSHDQQWSIK